MNTRSAPTLDFDSQSVALGYDRVLAPTLFEPWADRLIREHGPWKGQRVLDLATGTGVVAQRLAEAGCDVVAADINAQMLARARERCAPTVRFVESAAHPLLLADGSVDVVVCQQGFQFFPDKMAAAREIQRVLCENGRIVVSTWRPVADCRIFGALCDALDSIGEPDIAAKMRIPFDHLRPEELHAPFAAAGFANMDLRRKELELTFPGGVAQAIEFAYATPIGPLLHALPAGRQARFRELYSNLVRNLGDDDSAMGRMVSNELSAS